MKKKITKSPGFLVRKSKKVSHEDSDQEMTNVPAPEEEIPENPEDPESIEEFIKLKKLQNEVLHKMLAKIQGSEDQSTNINQ